MVKNPPANSGDAGSILGYQEDPLEKELQPTLVFLPGKSHGQRRATVHGVRLRDCNVETGLRLTGGGTCQPFFFPFFIFSITESLELVQMIAGFI